MAWSCSNSHSIPFPEIMSLRPLDLCDCLCQHIFRSRTRAGPTVEISK